MTSQKVNKRQRTLNLFIFANWTNSTCTNSQSIHQEIWKGIKSGFTNGHIRKQTVQKPLENATKYSAIERRIEVCKGWRRRRRLTERTGCDKNIFLQIYTSRAVPFSAKTRIIPVLVKKQCRRTTVCSKKASQSTYCFVSWAVSVVIGLQPSPSKKKPDGLEQQSGGRGHYEETRDARSDTRVVSGRARKSLNGTLLDERNDNQRRLWTKNNFDQAAMTLIQR